GEARRTITAVVNPSAASRSGARRLQGGATASAQPSCARKYAGLRVETARLSWLSYRHAGSYFLTSPKPSLRSHETTARNSESASNQNRATEMSRALGRLPVTRARNVHGLQR